MPPAWKVLLSTLPNGGCCSISDDLSCSREGFNLSVIILTSLLVCPMLGCRHSLLRLSNISRFYTPVFRRDVLWYGDVRPGLRPTVRPSDSPSVRPSGSPSARFPHFSHTCFDILSWNFAHHFVLMYYWSSSSVVTLRQFLKELCLFWNLEYR